VVASEGALFSLKGEQLLRRLTTTQLGALLSEGGAALSNRAGLLVGAGCADAAEGARRLFCLLLNWNQRAQKTCAPPPCVSMLTMSPLSSGVVGPLLQVDERTERLGDVLQGCQSDGLTSQCTGQNGGGDRRFIRLARRFSRRRC
jgi:hypothetical protein